VTLTASYTNLMEDNGLLGAQSGGALNFGNTHTSGLTLGATTLFGDGWQVSQSATLARSASGSQAGLMITPGGMRSTAYEVAIVKKGVIRDADNLSLTLAQPLHVEIGSLQFETLQVIDRDTGALGPVAQTWSVSGKREIRIEAAYGMPVLDGRGDIEAFSLFDANAPTKSGQTLSMTAGAKLRFHF
jgi:hypothetical protein